MSGAVKAAGDAITGGVIAGAVEPTRGPATAFHVEACLNCGTMLQGHYCHECGQAGHVHRTLTAVWHDIAHGVFHFEGKVWRTLPMLVIRPGGLTRRYVHGERARFVSPLALFLFSVFLMFATFESVGGPVRPKIVDSSGERIATEADFATQLAEARAEVARLERQRAAAVAIRQSTAAIDEALLDARNDVSGIATVGGYVTGKPVKGAPPAVQIDTGNASVDAYFAKLGDDPKLLAYKLQSNAYKFAWAIIPLSLPFMWAVFAWRRQYRLYDHAIFVTYSLSFVLLLLVAMALLSATGLSVEWLLLAVPVHFFAQLKGAYQLRRSSALWRTVALLISATIVLAVFAALLLALGLAG